MNESDVIRIRHMLDAAREALSFIAGRSSEDLSRDRDTLTCALPELLRELEIALAD